MWEAALISTGNTHTRSLSYPSTHTLCSEVVILSQLLLCTWVDECNQEDGDMRSSRRCCRSALWVLYTLLYYLTAFMIFVCSVFNCVSALHHKSDGIFGHDCTWWSGVCGVTLSNSLRSYPAVCDFLMNNNLLSIIRAHEAQDAGWARNDQPHTYCRIPSTSSVAFQIHSCSRTDLCLFSN